MLEEVEREFWTNVVHELKTPLALLHGYATTLLERDLPEEQRRWFLQVIADQSLRMSEGIDRLREVRSLERAEAELVGDAAVAIREAVGRLRETVPGVPISVTGDDRPVPVRGSERWLVRAFEEVLAAAAATSGEAGITVRLRRGSSVSVTVTTAGQVRLSGLGLYLARRVAERFGGNVSARASRISVQLVPVDG